MKTGHGKAVAKWVQWSNFRSERAKSYARGAGRSRVMGWGASIYS